MKNVGIKACFIIVLMIAVIIIFKQNNVKEEYVGNETDEEVIVEEESKDIFADYYDEADKVLETMTIDEKIGQLFLVRYPETNQVEEMMQYGFGGYLMFEKDFRNKDEETVKKEIANLQENSEIPLLIAVDEEGGSVVRVSSNKKLRSERFKSPRELYAAGGFEKIAEDTAEKSAFLSNLGINLNLAPVVDVSTDKKDYIYSRTLGEGTELVSEYAKTVIEAGKGGSVSYVLKHFPGYGSNVDTHDGSSVDNRSYEELMQSSLPPFRSGIESGAEAVLVSHNVVACVDASNAASISSAVHELIRNELGFTGVVMTDELDMGAVSGVEDVAVHALCAGNDLVIVTNYKEAIESVKAAVADGRIAVEDIDRACRKVVAWKFAKNLNFFAK